MSRPAPPGVPVPRTDGAVRPAAGSPPGRVSRAVAVGGGSAVVLASALAVLLVRPLRDASMIDLRIYRAAVRAAREGALYDFRFPPFDLPFTYPPFAALPLSALTPLPLGVAALMVTGVGLACLVAVLRYTLALQPLRGAFSGPGGIRRAWLLAVAGAAVALWFEPVLTTLRYGQVNLALAALVLYDLSRPDGARAKGLGVGLAAGFKLTPAIFAVYLGVTGRVRAAVVAGAGFLGTVAAGWAVWPVESRRYWGGLFLDGRRVGYVEDTANQSLRGVLARLLHSPDVEAVALGAALVAGVLGLAVAARLARSGDEARGVLACALTGLLCSPVSWSHHWVWAAPLLLVAVVWPPRTACPPRAAWPPRTACPARPVRVWLPVAAGLAVFTGALSHWAPRGSRAGLELAWWQQVPAAAYVLTAIVVLGWWAKSGRSPTAVAPGASGSLGS